MLEYGLSVPFWLYVEMKCLFTTVWDVPINILTQMETGTSKTKPFIMNKKQVEVTVPAKSGFVRFNAGQLSFFRCCYATKSKTYDELSCIPVSRNGSQEERYKGYCYD